MAKKAPPAPPPPPPSPWDVAITAAVMNDYNFRGVTQSRHQPSVQGGFELRYTVSPMWQYYAGISGESIDFPNHAAAEIDLYGGVRPTFDKLALDEDFDLVADNPLAIEHCVKGHAKIFAVDLALGAISDAVAHTGIIKFPILHH